MSDSKKTEFNHISMETGTELSQYTPGNDLLNTARDCLLNQGFEFKEFQGGGVLRNFYERKSDGAKAAMEYDGSQPRKATVSIKKPKDMFTKTYKMTDFIRLSIVQRVEEFVRAEEAKHVENLKKAAAYRESLKTNPK